ncbi:hypothetical protein [Chitinophaga sp. 212800010-3]|uniref:hypothetical protein n=1 Tax=unclassified Chitinophaga TaxID=2619133 RepID=UPI002DE62BFA|nr:DUF4397 domain-containing protein [Chitinophaga sp. 212800010-3]
MKRYRTQWLKTGITWGILVMILVAGLSIGTTLTGCRKARLFTNLDSIPEVPSRFHFFNTFDYNDSLSLSVDGLMRENVKQYSFSKYYSSSSAFNLNTAQPNSKLIKIYDPVLQSRFASLPGNGTFQFVPNTSYIVFVSYAAYDTTSSPKNNVVPQLIFFPEDVYHPFAGTTGIRFFNCLAGPSNAKLIVSPDMGQGTSATLEPQGGQPTRIGDAYNTTQQGLKKLSLRISRGWGADAWLTFLPFQLRDGKNYSFFAVGDLTNFLFGKQPRPRLFVVEDGVPASLRELIFSNLSYSSINGAQVTVINGAFNVPGLLVTPVGKFFGIDVQLNQARVKVIRWPTNPMNQDEEDIGLAMTRSQGGDFAAGMLQRIATTPVMPAGPYVVNVMPSGTFTPVYDRFNYNFESGLSYSLCLLPDLQSASKVGHLVLENDQSPDPKLFKLRIVNIMGGATLVDVHTGSPSGPVIASAVSYGQATDYISFKASLVRQNLYVTAAGATTPLFQTGANNGPISLPFTGGNSGTIYLMGLLPGTPYRGDNGYFKPYVYFNSDAYLDFRNALASSQLYYQL